MRAIITDSTTMLKNNEIENVYVLPVVVRINDEEYLDGVNITSLEVINKIDEANVTTSLPRIEDVISLLDQLNEKNYDEIVFVVMSKKLSGTYNSLRLILEDYQSKAKIVLIDSKTISVPLYSVIKYLVNDLNEEKIENLESHVNHFVKNNTRLYLSPENLKYLVKGGRLSAFSGIIADSLNIRPLIELVDGEFKVIKKCRGKLVVKDMQNMIYEFNNHATDSDFYLARGINEDADCLLDKLVEEVDYHLKEKRLLSPAVLAHVGPRVTGFYIVKK